MFSEPNSVELPDKAKEDTKPEPIITVNKMDVKIMTDLLLIHNDKYLAIIKDLR